MKDSDVNLIEGTVSTITSSLLGRVQAETTDEDAWERLVFLFSPLVYKWCRKSGLTSHDARDVGQQVFLKVSKNIRGFRRNQEYGTFRGWLRTITTNAVRDYWRREKSRPTPGGDGDNGEMPHATRIQFTDDDDSVAEDVKDIFKRILEHGQSHINPRHWRIFWRVVVEGAAPVDVADEFDVQRAYVDVVKSRVLASLRREFEEFNG